LRYSGYNPRMEERLQKILAQAGVGSRRDCEELILAGRVRVDGHTAVIGQKADPATARIAVDGRAIKAAEQKVYIALNKPRFVLTTVESETGDSRQTVRDLVPVSERLYPVGRLDFDSEGLILMTNDGDLAQKLTHPSHGHEKEYRVLVGRHPDDEQLATWRRGVVLEDGYKTQPANVSLASESGKGMWLRVVMKEGRKRQIREIGAKLGLPVVRILRVRIGSLRLGTLKTGEWRYLTAEEIAGLKGDAPRPAPRPKRVRQAPVAQRPHPEKVKRRGPEKPPENGGKPQIRKSR
jgi:23S rRNA pseudouridine2605 synthase